MNKPEQKRRSSASTKKRHSTDTKSDSIKEDDVSHKDFSSNAVILEKPKINYQDELVLIFFNSMLDVIVDEWVTVPNEPPQVCFCNDSQTKSSSLAKNEQNLSTGDVPGSKVSLKGNMHKRRSSPGSKDSNQTKDTAAQELLVKRQRSKSSDRVKSPGRESIDERSKTSIKRRSKDSSKSDSRKSRTSGFSYDSSVHQTSLDWILDPPDENVIIRFKNGNRYEGPVTKKLMHGFGKFIWADGTIYEGDFVHGYATGHGMLQYPDLSFYHGSFCKSLLHGEGVLNISSTPMIYTGLWKASEKHGEGWLLYESGDWYEGEWYEDKRQGMGYRQYKNGSRYKGDWYQGEQHGQGTLIWYNNDLYKGEWKNGIMDGYGEYTWNAFLNDSFTFPIENVYQGTWVNGKRDGVGIINFGADNGAQLAGIWQGNMKHGPGVMVCGNGKLIERNPLFWCDKPIHLDIEADPGYPVFNFTPENTPPTSTHNIQPHANKSTMLLIAEQVRSKNESKMLDSQILEKIEQSRTIMKGIDNGDMGQSDFLTGRSLNSPLSIPMQLAPEQTDFSHYITIAVQKYTAELYKWELSNEISETLEFPLGIAHGFTASELHRLFSGKTAILYINYLDLLGSEFENNGKKLPVITNISGGIRTDTCPSWVSKYSKWNVMSHLTNLSRSFKSSPGRIMQSPSDLQSKLANLHASQVQIEVKNLRDTIITNLSNLHKLYYKYATIASPHSISFKPILIRLFLWQMLRDLNILKRKYTLVDMDLILISNPGCSLESEHHPFEKIYFWQFLQILVTLAWLTHSPSDVSEECKYFGILSAIFKKFLQDIIYNNVEFTFSCSLFEYRDLLPVNSVYLLYQSLGEPHTARKFLNSVCTRKREQPPCYLKIFKDEKTPKLTRGINAVPVGGNIVYLPNDPPGIGEKPLDPDPEPSTDDPFRKELFVLRFLGPKKVIECLVTVCPQIANEGVIVNMEYPLTFIEFYDTFLLCGFMVVDQTKKREEKRRLQEQKKASLEIEQHERSRSATSHKGGKSREKPLKAKK